MRHSTSVALLVARGTRCTLLLRFPPTIATAQAVRCIVRASDETPAVVTNPGVGAALVGAIARWTHTKLTMDGHQQSYKRWNSTTQSLAARRERHRRSMNSRCSGPSNVTHANRC